MEVNLIFRRNVKRTARDLPPTSRLAGRLRPEPTTHKTKASYFKRLRDVFGDDFGENFELLEWVDYDTIADNLGWSEATFKSVLGYLGKETGTLRNNVRNYIPTQSDWEALMAYVSHDAVLALMTTGCRWSELWSMEIPANRPNLLIVYTAKGGVSVTLDLTQFTKPGIRQSLEAWVKTGCQLIKPETLRKRWQKAVHSVPLDPLCTPHAFRHRAATLGDNAGYDIEDIRELLGHRSSGTTRRYRHKQLAKFANDVLAP